MGRLVHIVDDDADVRRGTGLLLEDLGYDVRTHESGRAFLGDAIGEEAVVLLDLAMPGMNGLDVLTALERRGMHLPVIVLTGHGDVDVAVSAMKLGAVDFLEKPYDAAALAITLDSAFKAAERTAAARKVKAAAAAKLALLTPREVQIVQGLRAGMANKAVARWLGLSPRTVESYRANIMARLDIQSFPALLRIAHEGGLAEIDPAGG